MTTHVPHLRTVRSFVRRQGRITVAQERALEEMWPRFGVEAGDELLDLDALFGRQAARVLEIGFGDGGNLVAMAEAHPDTDYLGIEVHRPGVGRLLMEVGEKGLANVRVMCTDAVEVLTRQIPDASLDAVLLFFPDPWHKMRHHKRRIVQPEFAELVRRKLVIGGRFHMATDWEDYAHHMLAVMQAAPGYRNLSPGGDYVPRPEHRVLTKFERRGQRLGHGVWDLVFIRIS
ncbi:MAG: tRNA (guanosine(46)-N7)-methyltransferase TrmB [Thiohalomonadaceae bacterium]